MRIQEPKPSVTQLEPLPLDMPELLKDGSLEVTLYPYCYGESILQETKSRMCLPFSDPLFTQKSFPLLLDNKKPLGKSGSLPASEV